MVSASGLSGIIQSRRMGSSGLVAISQLQEPLCLHQLWEDGSWHVLGLWDLLEWAALFSKVELTQMPPTHQCHHCCPMWP